MRLSDLRVVTPPGRNLYGIEPSDLKPATVSDLISALISEGGTVMDSNNAIEIGWFTGESRRYLVFRIPEEETQRDDEPLW